MEAIRKLVNNAWNWNVNDFARETGLPPYPDIRTQEKFLHFQAAATALRQLDDHILAVVTGTAQPVPVNNGDDAFRQGTDDRRF